MMKIITDVLDSVLVIQLVVFYFSEKSLHSFCFRDSLCWFFIIINETKYSFMVFIVSNEDVNVILLFFLRCELSKKLRSFIVYAIRVKR